LKPITLAAALLVSLALAAAVGLALGRAPAETADAGPPAAEATSRGQIRALEARVDELSREQASLRAELSFLRSQTVSPIDAAVSSPGWRTPETEPAQPTPLWYLERYEKSFDDGGGGSEYFRLAVAAYARELYEPIETRISDESRPLILRQHLVGILGEGGFKGDGRVMGLLAAIVGDSAESELAQEALSALGSVGDARAVPLLEPEIWDIRWPDLQLKAIELGLAFAGEDGNAFLLRLMRSAPSDAQFIPLIGMLRTSELPTALESFQVASRESQPVRLAAALHIDRFRGPEFTAFIDAWAAVERDPDVQAALGRARDQQLETPTWSAARATGPPDANPGSDDPHAWASQRGDMGDQWLELTYAPSRRASGVRIFEVNAAGAVTAVIGFDEQGVDHALWSGVDPTVTPGVLELSFPTTPFAVSRLRIVLDTNRTPDWNEIDAVELYGPDGRAWASQAVASSEYGH
jgi:hypothetical protein